MNDSISNEFKIEMLNLIKQIINENSWTQTEAASKLSISRSRLCKALSGDIDDVSEFRLMKCVIDSGSCVEVHVKKFHCQKIKVFKE